MVTIEKNSKGKTLYYVAVDIILVKDGKVLLQRRANTGWMDGKWNMPGGHIEDEKTLEQVAVREAKEELGIEVAEKDVRIIHAIQNRTNRQTILFYATCDKYVGTPSVQPEIEDSKQVFKADAVEWFDINNLPKDTAPHARNVVKCFLGKRPFSRFGFKGEYDE